MAQQGYYPQRQTNRAYQQPQYMGPFTQPQYAQSYAQPQYMQPQQQAPAPKKSGAKYTPISKGKFAGTGLKAVSAWRATKQGLLSVKAFPVDGVEHTGGQNGHTFMRYVVEVSNPGAGTSQTYWSIMRMDTQKITIKELGFVITPNGSGITRSGKRVTGYFGPYLKK